MKNSKISFFMVAVAVAVAVSLWGTGYYFYNIRTETPTEKQERTLNIGSGIVVGFSAEGKKFSLAYYREGNMSQSLLIVSGEKDGRVKAFFPSEPPGDAYVPNLPDDHERYFTLVQKLKEGVLLPQEELFDLMWQAYGQRANSVKVQMSANFPGELTRREATTQDVTTK